MIETQLQAETAKVQHDIEQGTVTAEEANRLHSLENRAHGHTEKGGVTAHAQSLVAGRARGASASNGSGQRVNREEELHQIEDALRDKVEHDPEHVTREDASNLISHERQAHGIVQKGSLASKAQSLADRNEDLHKMEEAVREKLEHDPEHLTRDEAIGLARRERRVHGGIEKGSLPAQAQSIADKNADLHAALEAVSLKEPGQVTKDDAATLQSREARIDGPNTAAGSTAAQVQSIADKNEAGAVVAAN
ncbi:hypothetical protein M011DRAFT_464589 [Sporormia fimetaria CBS 119925]|uniref:SMP domain-containing protein n=1 Tax=Sporormia fimetaria CBS 119925 TaxID=1340428 RepID=A0A6A6VNI9_9PLEO|nr:hypothetical protein M011DRAFT_464589 [Sporormia fimetaria CBS 119925]